MQDYWRARSTLLLFDANYKPNPAYNAVVAAMQVMGEGAASRRRPYAWAKY